MRQVIFFDVDTQFDFIDKRGKLSIKNAAKIIPNLKKLTQLAKREKILIVASVDCHKKTDAEFKIFPPHCIKETLGQRKLKETILKNRVFLPREKKVSLKILNALVAKKQQIILEKDVLDVFSNPNLKNLIKDTDVAYVYGVATEYCVKALVLGLLRSKVKTYIVKDAVKGVGELKAEKALRLMQAKGARLITTQKIIRSLS